jgi:hypothetical protein
MADGIHALRYINKKGVDTRTKCGHDDFIAARFVAG